MLKSLFFFFFFFFISRSSCMGLARLSLLRTYLASSASLPRALSRAGGGEGWLLLYIWACEEAEDWCVMRYLWPKSVEI
ncbi:hypothetical protein IWX92DRAFT_358603, partial [Phyllosticta citricarpa]